MACWWSIPSVTHRNLSRPDPLLLHGGVFFKVLKPDLAGRHRLDRKLAAVHISY